MATLIIKIILGLSIIISVSCSRNDIDDLLKIRDNIITNDFLQRNPEFKVTPITRNVRNIVIEIDSVRYYVFKYNKHNKNSLKFNEIKQIGFNRPEILDTVISDKIFNLMSTLDNLSLLSIEHCETANITIYRTTINKEVRIWAKEKYVLIHLNNSNCENQIKNLKKDYRCLYDFNDQYHLLDNCWVFYSSNVYGEYDELSDFLRWKIFASY